MALKFSGSFNDLKAKLASIPGEWDESLANQKVLKSNSGVMNWFDSTGTINFQGKDPGKSELENTVPNLLKEPSEHAPPSIDLPGSARQFTHDVTAVSTEPVVEVGTLSSAQNVRETDNIETSVELQYLTTGVNTGELVLGIVSAVGTEYQQVTSPLKERLELFGYQVHEVRVSELLPAHEGETTEYKRIKHYMESGDSMRKSNDNNAILAAGVAQKIAGIRGNDSSPGKNAYIVNSLKHPREVEFLRKVYGDGFYLIGIHASEIRRRKRLTQDKGCTETQANELIKIDEDESFNDHGQKTRDTYHLADFFLSIGGNTDQIKNRLQRFLELIFSHPYKNPTFDEFAMFMAFNSSVRSGDLSRQVGAVITRNQQILATGANDVPKSGGGQYFAEVNPQTGEVTDFPYGKDYTRDNDSNKQTQTEIISEITKKILSENLVDSSKELELQKLLKDSKISDLTEFGRVVHAEMDALLSCSREGIPTVDSTLYCTTFPCHNCAKHVIAGGIKRVVYVEPYPKSRALDFHSESIHLLSELDTASEELSNMVIFEPFTGIGPRRFLDLFSMSLGAGSKLRRKDKSGATVEWDKATAPIRTPLIPHSYLEIEKAASQMWADAGSGNG
jgi:deoxycytidylate deaminase